MTCFMEHEDVSKQFVMEHEDVSKQFETQRHKDTEFFILLIHKLIPSVSLCLRVLFFNFLRNLLLGKCITTKIIYNGRAVCGKKE